MALDRSVSSMQLLAARVHAVGDAWRSGDEQLARLELSRLSEEATLLARMYPLPGCSRTAARQAIAAER